MNLTNQANHRQQLRPGIWSFTISKPIGECRYLRTVTTDTKHGRTYITSKKVIIFKRQVKPFTFYEVM